MISRKFAYADNVVLLHSSGNWKELQGTLSQDMTALLAFNNRLLPICATPTYLGLKLNKSLMFCHHLFNISLSRNYYKQKLNQ